MYNETKIEQEALEISLIVILTFTSLIFICLTVFLLIIILLLLKYIEKIKSEESKKILQENLEIELPELQPIHYYIRRSKNNEDLEN